MNQASIADLINTITTLQAEQTQIFKQEIAGLHTQLALTQQQLALTQQQHDLSQKQVVFLSKKLGYLPPVADVPYDPNDKAILATFWSTNCNARTNKLKEFILAKHIPLADFVAIMDSVYIQKGVERVYDPFSRVSTTHLHFPQSLRLMTTLPLNFPNEQDSRRVEIHRRNFPSVDYLSETLAGLNGVNRENINKFLPRFFPQLQGQKSDLSTITAENIDQVDVDNFNIYRLVPKDKCASYFFERLKALPVYLARDGATQCFSLEQFFAMCSMQSYHPFLSWDDKADRVRKLINDPANLQLKFDFDKLKIVDQ